MGQRAMIVVESSGLQLSEEFVERWSHPPAMFLFNGSWPVCSAFETKALAAFLDGFRAELLMQDIKLPFWVVAIWSDADSPSAIECYNVSARTIEKKEWCYPMAGGEPVVF